MRATTHYNTMQTELTLSLTHTNSRLTAVITLSMQMKQLIHHWRCGRRSNKL